MSGESIQRFFARYAESYMALDVDAVAAMYEAPLLVVREGRATHLGDRAAVRDHLAGLIDAYRKAGATRATVADLHLIHLDSTSAIATVRWNAFSVDGALLRDFTTSYQLLGDERGGWRILSYTYHHE